MEKPNLLFIFTDEQRYDTMAAYGNSQIEVPNLNGLSKEGIVFEKAYVTQPICTPSRASIMTGLYPHTVGCVANNILLPEDVPVFPENADFREYKKGYIGKWHLGDEIFCQHGFDEWVSIEDNYRRHNRWYRDRFLERDKPPWEAKWCRDVSIHSSYHNWLVTKGFKPTEKTQDGYEWFSRQFAARLPEKFCKPSFIAEMTSQFITKNSDRPFMLYVNFLEPHMPWYGPRDTQYSPEDVTLPENFHVLPTKDQPLKAQLASNIKLARIANLARAAHKVKKIPDMYSASYMYPRFLGKESPTEADWRQLIARYWGLVSQVDTALGKILDTVRKCGLEKDTIIVFTSDHGDMMGSHQLVHKGFQFEEAIRVPLIIKIPGHLKSGSVISEPVSQVDLVPTLLDYMGKPVPRGLDGFSLRPLIEGGKPHEENVFIEWFPNNMMHRGSSDEIDHPVITIITPEGWKYNYSSFGQHELYNLKEDSLESTNLVHCKQYRSLLKKLEKKIETWKTRTQYVVHRHIVHNKTSFENSRA
jgi:arylsulfatase A-like enzyme